MNRMPTLPTALAWALCGDGGASLPEPRKVIPGMNRLRAFALQTGRSRTSPGSGPRLPRHSVPAAAFRSAVLLLQSLDAIPESQTRTSTPAPGGCERLRECGKPERCRALGAPGRCVLVNTADPRNDWGSAQDKRSYVRLTLQVKRVTG